jgi:hypothetical protein
MSIGANSSDKQVVGSSLYTGLHNVKVVAINPSMEELKAMGINATKEPEYKTEEQVKDADGNITGKYSKIRVDFYFTSGTPGINLSKTTKLSCWLEDRVRVNKDGNKEEWINKFGGSTWGKSIDVAPEYDWLSKEGLRKAYVGEVDLVNFVKSWANVDPKDQATFDNVSAIANGNITEILSLFNAIKLNQVKVLLGVKEGKYQTVYTKYFDRAYRNTFTGWKKSLDSEYGEFKGADYQSDLTFKQYTGSAAVGSDNPTLLDAPAGVPAGGYKF